MDRVHGQAQLAQDGRAQDRATGHRPRSAQADRRGPGAGGQRQGPARPRRPRRRRRTGSGPGEAPAQPVALQEGQGGSRHGHRWHRAAPPGAAPEQARERRPQGSPRRPRTWRRCPRRRHRRRGQQGREPAARKEERDGRTEAGQDAAGERTQGPQPREAKGPAALAGGPLRGPRTAPGPRARKPRERSADRDPRGPGPEGAGWRVRALRRRWGRSRAGRAGSPAAGYAGHPAPHGGYGVRRTSRSGPGDRPDPARDLRTGRVGEDRLELFGGERLAGIGGSGHQTRDSTYVVARTSRRKPAQERAVRRADSVVERSRLPMACSTRTK